MEILNFDQLVEKKGDRGMHVFVLCLDNESSFLNDESHWIHNSAYSVQVARLSESEFNILDMGKHPKLWVLENGEEKLQINGIPTYNEFLRHMKGMS